MKWIAIVDLRLQRKSMTTEAMELCLQSIRLIEFRDLRKLKSFPRFPENKSICISADKIDYENSFIIFLSHCWLRGSPKSPGFDKRAHPDDASNSKFRLLLEAASFLWSIMAKNMKYCYLWIDYGCIDQDGNPAGELKQLDEIIRVCDCLLTVVHDVDWDKWSVEDSVDGYLVDYKATAWQEGYLNRAWCRVEMLYAAHVPLRPDNTQKRIEKFRAGVKSSLSVGHRAHFLYGTKESKVGFSPEMLCPLRDSYLEKLRPDKGNLSYERDREKISELVSDLTKYIKKPEYGYIGKYNAENQREGYGKLTLSNRFVYDGEWLADLPHGRGKVFWPNGNFYEGTLLQGAVTGTGHASYAFGGLQDGEFVEGAPHGHGTMTFATGTGYKGDFVNGDLTGKGDAFYSDGVLAYRGYWNAGTCQPNWLICCFASRLCYRICENRCTYCCRAYDASAALDDINYDKATQYVLALILCGKTAFSQGKREGALVVATRLPADLKSFVNMSPYSTKLEVKTDGKSFDSGSDPTTQSTNTTDSVLSSHSPDILVGKKI